MPSSDDNLISRCKAGETSAYTEFYRQHAKMVFRVCVSLLGDRSEAEDVVQVVFTTAFAKLDSFSGKSKVSSWLYGIAIRVLANKRRSMARRNRLKSAVSADPGTLSTSPPTQEKSATMRQSFAQMAEVLDRLSDKHRTAFMLYYGSGLTLAEIAEATGSPLPTIANRVKAAKRKIMKEMPEEMQVGS